MAAHKKGYPLGCGEMLIRREFNYFRNTLSSNAVKWYYDPNKEHEMITDACPVGISVILGATFENTGRTTK